MKIFFLNIKFIFIFFLSLSLIIFFWHSSFFTLPIQKTLKKEESHLIIDAFMENSFSQSFNEAGLLQETLHCTEWTHHKNINQTTLSSPRFMRQQRPGYYWYLQAEQGFAFDTKMGKVPKHILLTKAVEASQFEHDKRSWQLFTEKLSLYPAEERCETTATVRLESNGSVVASTGLQAFLNHPTVEFKNHVQSLYLIQPDNL
jgi:LPS export ABC transporter protein LptC